MIIPAAHSALTHCSPTSYHCLLTAHPSPEYSPMASLIFRWALGGRSHWEWTSGNPKWAGPRICHELDLHDALGWFVAVCVYLDRSRTKCRRNLRVEPLFSEGFGFAHLAFRLSRARKGSNYFASPTSIHTHKPVWAP